MSSVVRFAQLCLPALLLGVTVIAAACASPVGEVGTPTPTVSASPTPQVSGPTAVPGPGVTATQIALGMTNDMAGTGDTPYAAVTLAMQAYFRKVNAEGHGACGRSVALTTEDDGYSPATALDKTKKLIDQNSVLAM